MLAKCAVFFFWKGFFFSVYIWSLADCSWFTFDNGLTATVGVNNLKIVTSIILGTKSTKKGTHSLCGCAFFTNYTTDIFWVDTKRKKNAFFINFTINTYFIRVVYESFYDIFYELLVNACHRFSGF